MNQLNKLKAWHFLFIFIVIQLGISLYYVVEKI